MRGFSVVFTAVVLFSLLGAVVVEAVSADQVAGTANSSPTIDSLMTAVVAGGADQPSFALLENLSRAIYIHGSGRDANGCEDINNPTGWRASIFRQGVALGKDCSADSNNCYQASSATDLSLSGCYGADDLTVDYAFEKPLAFWADATDVGSKYASEAWSVVVEVEDEQGSTPMERQDSFEMLSLVSFQVDSNVSYGTVDLGADSEEQVIQFTATGNRAVDAQQAATSQDNGNMVCSGSGSQNIPVGNVHLSFEQGFSYGAGDHPLSSDPQILQLNLPARTSESSPLTKRAYLVLRVPSNGINGVCLNSISFLAITDS